MYFQDFCFEVLVCVNTSPVYIAQVLGWFIMPYLQNLILFFNTDTTPNPETITWQICTVAYS